MCGRFANHVQDMGRWGDILGDWPDEVAVSYNIAPGADIAAFTKEGGAPMRWGLVPAWSKTARTRYATFNARSEFLIGKPAFRGAWKHGQRCLIPLQGYYEWQTLNGGKQPYYLFAASGEPLVCAGLWDQWGSGPEQFQSCTMITRAASPAIAFIHPRMPLFVPLFKAREWLEGKPDSCAELLGPDVTPANELKLGYYPVSQQVNNPRNEGAGLCAPLLAR